MSDAEYDTSSNSISSFNVVAGILNLFFCMTYLHFSMYSKCQRFDKATYLSFLFKFILSIRLNNSLLGSVDPLFVEFINVVPTLSYSFMEFVIFSYIFLVNSFSQCK